MIGDRPVDKIEGPLIRDVLAPIWFTKPETAPGLPEDRCGARLELREGLPEDRSAHALAVKRFAPPASQGRAFRGYALRGRAEADRTVAGTLIGRAAGAWAARELGGIAAKFPQNARTNESQTEDYFIWPVLAALGWSDPSPTESERQRPR